MVWVPYEHGLTAIVGYIQNAPGPKPIIVMITGQPNSGKTHLRLASYRQLEQEDFQGWTAVGMDPFESNIDLVTDPSFILVEDVGTIPSTIDRHVRDEFGKPTDLHVYIARDKNHIPEHEAQFLHLYHLLIENPEAKKKR